MLLGLGLFFFDKTTARRRAVAQWFALATFPIALLAILGYATGALSAGFQVHIAKPVDPHELTLAVASLAGRIGA